MTISIKKAQIKPNHRCSKKIRRKILHATKSTMVGSSNWKKHSNFKSALLTIHLCEKEAYRTKSIPSLYSVVFDSYRKNANASSRSCAQRHIPMLFNCLSSVPIFWRSAKYSLTNARFERWVPLTYAARILNAYSTVVVGNFPCWCVRHTPHNAGTNGGRKRQQSATTSVA